jgi:hypothetical protein
MGQEGGHVLRRVIWERGRDAGDWVDGKGEGGRRGEGRERENGSTGEGRRQTTFTLTITPTQPHLSHLAASRMGNAPSSSSDSFSQKALHVLRVAESSPSAEAGIEPCLSLFPQAPQSRRSDES